MLCGVERDLALSEREPEPPFDVHGSCTDGFHCAITVASGCNGLVHRNRAEETHERVTHISELDFLTLAGLLSIQAKVKVDEVASEWDRRQWWLHAVKVSFRASLCGTYLRDVLDGDKLEVIVEWFGVDFTVLCCLFVKEFGKALALGLVNCVMREFPDVHRSVFRAAMGAPKYQNVSLGSATLILCSPIRMPAVSSLSMVETLYICNTLMWRELHTIHPSELIHMVDGSKSVREV